MELVQENIRQFLCLCTSTSPPVSVHTRHSIYKDALLMRKKATNFPIIINFTQANLWDFWDLSNFTARKWQKASGFANYGRFTLCKHLSCTAHTPYNVLSAKKLLELFSTTWTVNLSEIKLPMFSKILISFPRR